ncbi:hypothetical protein KJ785_04525 [Patescibacteria group bacterium]|nr:hypothetical protein [Patescibacteria group bacterium]
MGGIKYKNSLEKMLDKKNKPSFEKIVAKMEDNLVFQNKVCAFFHIMVGEDLSSFENDKKFQVCLDYLIIGLVSGDVKKSDLDKLLES